MNNLDNLNIELVKFVCDMVFKWNKRTEEALNYEIARSSKYTDEDLFLVLDALIEDGLVEFDNKKLIDIGDPKKKLKETGYIK